MRWMGKGASKEKDGMKYFRRLTWFAATRLLVVVAVLGIFVMAFYFAMNAANIYVILKDGMARRAQVIMMEEDPALLEDYFSPICLGQDEMLRVTAAEGSVYTNYYDITGIDHRLNLEYVWCWPWDDTASATFVERIVGIDGRIKSSQRTQGLEMGLTVSPPAWETIRYDAILVRENGRWIIRDLGQREVIQ